MRCVILAGGRGTRISEESEIRPKPMVEIGGWPILWHIMKLYGTHGVGEFVICLGYRGFMIKEWFVNRYLHSSDVTVDMATNEVHYHASRAEPWKVTLVDTGASTQTGGRVKRVRDYVGDEPFYLTYGDGLADVDLTAQAEFHRSHGRLVTMTVVRPPARFGTAVTEGDRVVTFEEKWQAASGQINGGFFVVSPEALDEVEGDDTVWESGPLRRLAAREEVRAWHHDGFWQPMDTLREKMFLDDLWTSGAAPWATWT